MLRYVRNIYIWYVSLYSESISYRNQHNCLLKLNITTLYKQLLKRLIQCQNIMIINNYDIFYARGVARYFKRGGGQDPDQIGAPPLYLSAAHFRQLPSESMPPFYLLLPLPPTPLYFSLLQVQYRSKKEGFSHIT